MSKYLNNFRSFLIQIKINLTAKNKWKISLKNYYKLKSKLGNRKFLSDLINLHKLFKKIFHLIKEKNKLLFQHKILKSIGKEKATKNQHKKHKKIVKN